MLTSGPVAVATNLGSSHTCAASYDNHGDPTTGRQLGQGHLWGKSRVFTRGGSDSDRSCVARAPRPGRAHLPPGL